MPDVFKSTRHAKITGDFGEHLALYWLSKHGFECARVDHTGIDIIARPPNSKRLIGISVKARSRTPGKEGTSLVLKKRDIEMARQACVAFTCDPYFCFCVDHNDRCLLYMMPIDRLLKEFRSNSSLNWKLTEQALSEYRLDRDMFSLELSYGSPSWGCFQS